MKNNNGNKPTRTRRGPGALFSNEIAELGTITRPKHASESARPQRPTKPRDWRMFPTHFTHQKGGPIIPWPEDLTPYTHINFILQLPLEDVHAKTRKSPHDYVVVRGIGRVHAIFWEVAPNEPTRWDLINGYTHFAKGHKLP